ncbi:hypothetical protein FAES_3270 [Fibrella aestuarina BUZ 2]|uniref:Uncharacterized protein n=1 Tax=Fibrella aestuarina BUZ 2 TaxID=1166018 RepID=I0KAX6_9BACT|nr:hypothetical protein [Fibrella aestuarina]CCH01279.1 hypothetical protein FAES_3270 [Fibrella aestuarina BUZ 2]
MTLFDEVLPVAAQPVDYTGYNMATTYNTVNDVFIKNPISYTEANGTINYFKIKCPTSFTAALMNPKQYAELSGALRAANIRHSSEFYPAGYFDYKSKEVWYSITVDAPDFDYNLDVRLLQFGCSYGKISINGHVFRISHGGGSGQTDEGQPTWTEYTGNWNIVGQPVELIRLILASRKQY